MTETWIKNEDEALRLNLPNYTHNYNYRTTSRGGGVSIYVHNSLKHELINEQCEDGNHFLWIHLEKLSLDIGAIYKQPASNVQKFLDNYAIHLTTRKRAIVFGDLNLNLLSLEKSNKEYKLLIKENGYRLLNKIDNENCTRITGSSKTILDHVCTNLKDTTFHMALVDSSMSDHKQIYFEVQRVKLGRPKKMQYQALEYNNLYKSIEDSSIHSLNDEYTNLETVLLQAISQNKKTTTKLLNPPQKDWINKHLIESINRRNLLWHNLKQIPEDENLKEKFLQQRTAVHENIQTTKSQYYYKLFKKYKNNPRKMWQLISDLANNKVKTNLNPLKLNTPSGQITNSVDICEYFNSFFSNIGAELANKIPKSNSKNQLVQKSSNTQSALLLELMPVTSDEVARIIDNLDSNTSIGIDGISTKAVKCVKTLITDKLTQCINRCLIEGKFPESLKIAKVSPIFKAGNKMDPGNYRPISVLPILSKIFEKVLHKRLSEFLKSTDFLCHKQYGFRPKSNTLTATIDLVTNIKLNIDKKMITLGVFIDLKKAFDTVSHDILLMKLKLLGVQGSAYEIFKSYLTNRYQIVKIDGIQSTPRLMTYGVPQGSILGPLLFLVYINSLQDIGLKGDITLYADDTSLFYSGHSIVSIIEQAQHDLDLLYAWLQSNLLTINTSKTNFMIFTAKNKKIGQYPSLTINHEIINKVDKEKYLGLILDSKLTWKPHIDKIRSRLASLAGLLRNMSRCLPKRVRYTIYNSMVKSHIDYLIEIWGTAAKTNLQLLQRAQNKIIKALFRYDYLTPSLKLYKDTKIMSLTHIYTYNTCILVRKILTKDIHSQITFTKKTQIKKRLTRQANHICLRAPRTNYGKKSIMYEGGKLYNNLPKDIKEIKSLIVFKKVLKSYILKNLSSNP